VGSMIRRGFLNTAERKALLSPARNGSAEHRIARRANAILLLDDGLSCERVAKAACEAGTTSAPCLGQRRSPRRRIAAPSHFFLPAAA
jgi:hypothetical protein